MICWYFEKRHLYGYFLFILYPSNPGSVVTFTSAGCTCQSLKKVDFIFKFLHLLCNYLKSTVLFSCESRICEIIILDSRVPWSKFCPYFWVKSNNDSQQIRSLICTLSSFYFPVTLVVVCFLQEVNRWTIPSWAWLLYRFYCLDVSFVSLVIFFDEV